MKGQDKKVKVKKTPYVAPAIIYTGEITTRAGTGGCHKRHCGHGEGDTVDPADLFGS